ncbi:MAG: UDP-glucuronic acid decarboxylase family protein [Bacillota bacterium]
MRILVAGGAGFIGTNLCMKLIGEGHSVFCVDNLYTGNLENIKQLLAQQKFTFFKEDITQLDKEIGVERIYNLACPASPKQYQKDPVYTLKTNILGSLKLLNLAKGSNARILQASTSEVYGDPEIHPQTEEYRGNVNCTGIRSCYDEGKRAAETLFMDYHRLYHTPVRIVRIFNTYGPYMDQDDGRVVSNFITRALKGEPLEIYGDGAQTRSFCYIDDLVEGLVKMMEQDSLTGPVNLGNDEECPVFELAQKILVLTRSTSPVVYKPLPQDDPVKRRPCIKKAKEFLCWEPKIKLEQGLSKTIEYFKKQMTLMR